MEKRGKLISKYTEDQVRKSSVLVDSVMCLKGLFQMVEGWWEGKNSREKKIFGFVENERAEQRVASRGDQRTFECVLWDGFS